jgi:hypothetical protein
MKLALSYEMKLGKQSTYNSTSLKNPLPFSRLCDKLTSLSMESNFWEIVLITLNERPKQVWSGFFVGRTSL